MMLSDFEVAAVVWRGWGTQSLERATHGAGVLGSITVVLARFLLVGQL